MGCISFKVSSANDDGRTGDEESMDGVETLYVTSSYLGLAKDPTRLNPTSRLDCNLGVERDYFSLSTSQVTDLLNHPSVDQ